ncbi:MAG: tetratricopeptide repeat protein [Myxococcota bacterium]
MSRTLLTALLPLLLVAAPDARAGDDDARKDKLLEGAKGIYAKRDSLMLHKKAAGAFAAIAKEYPEDKDLQIWCARTAYYAAHRIEDSGVKERVARRGVRCAKRILKRDRGDYEGRLWWLMTRFQAEQAKGIMAALESADSIRSMLATMIKKHPDRFEAYMILGSVYREAPGSPVSFGDEDKALKLLKKAAELAPNNVEVLLELAQAYAVTDQEAKARATYRKCIDEGEGPPNMGWETRDAKRYAKKMLAELD